MVMLVVTETLIMPGNRSPVCRCLFGRPDPGDVDKFLQDTEEALHHLTDNASLRWDFDFRAGRPLEDIPGRSRRYEWTPVDGQDLLPPAYSSLLASLEQSATASEVSADIVGEPPSEVVTPSTSNASVISSETSTATASAESPSSADLQYSPPTDYMSPNSASGGRDSTSNSTYEC